MSADSVPKWVFLIVLGAVELLHQHGRAEAIEVAIRTPAERAADPDDYIRDAVGWVRGSAAKMALRMAKCLDRGKCNNHLAEPDNCPDGWAPVDTIIRGPEYLAELERHALTGLPVDEGYGHGSVIAEEGPSTPEGQVLARCYVRLIGGVAGPPGRCSTVAFITPEKTFLQAVVVPDGAPQHTCASTGTTREGGSVDIDFNVETELPVKAFSDSLAQLLRIELGFSSEQKVYKGSDGSFSSVEFRATTGLRESPILQGGWREAVDLDLDIRVGENGNISVQANASAMVSRTASGALNEYHGLNDAQRSTYISFLNERINGAITRVCREFLQADDKNIVCR